MADNTKYTLAVVLLAVFVIFGCGEYYNTSDDNIDGYGNIGSDGDNESVDNETNTVDELSTTGSIAGKARLKRLDDNSGIYVMLMFAGNIVGQIETDSDGSYHFDEIDPGTYDITASWREFTIEKQVNTTVKVLPDKTALPEDLELTPTGNLEGIVLLENAQTGNLGIEVFASAHSYMARTDDEGNWLLSNIPAGTYQICADMKSYEIKCVNDVDVIAKQTESVQSISLDKAEMQNASFASFSGTALLSGLEDNSGISVYLNGTDLITQTDSDGNYRINDIPQGKYNVVFDAPDESGYEKGVTIPNYLFWADVHDDTLPVVELNYGVNIGKAEAIYLYQDKYIQNSGMGFFTNNRLLYKYDSITKQITLISDDLYSYEYIDEYEILGDNKGIVYVTGGNTRYYYNVDTNEGFRIGGNIYSPEYSPDFSGMIFKQYYAGTTSYYYVSFGDGKKTLIGEDIIKIEEDETWSAFIYKNEDDDLYLFDTTSLTSTLLAENVVDYQVKPDYSMLVYSKFVDTFETSLSVLSLTDNSSILISEDMAGYEVKEDWSKVLFKTKGTSLYDLYIASLDDGTANLVGEDATAHTLSEDWTSVIYETSGTSYQVYSLYRSVAPEYIPQLLSENVYDHKFSEDNTIVLYREYPAPYNLYSVPPSAEAPVLLGSSDDDYTISPDNKYVIYIDYSSPNTIYSAPVSGGTSHALLDSINVFKISFSPDLLNVLIRSTNWEIFIAPLAGGAAVKLADNIYFHPAFNQDWTKMIYENQDDELYMVSVNDGDQTLIGEDVYSKKVNDDWSRLIYETNTHDIYLVNPNTLTKTKLGSDVDFNYTNEDMTRMLYDTESNELFYANLLNGETRLLGENVKYFEYNDTWTHVVFKTYDDFMYSYSINDDETFQLGDKVIPAYNLISDDFTTILYKTDDDGLYSVSILDGQAQTLGKNVRNYYRSEDEKFVVYETRDENYCRASLDGTQNQCLGNVLDYIRLFDDFSHILYTKTYDMKTGYIDHSCIKLNLAEFD